MLAAKPRNPLPPIDETPDPYQPWQRRVIDEKDELNVKITKLGGYLAGEQFPTLDQAEQDRLTRQLSVMQEYRSILAARIEAWNPPPTVSEPGNPGTEPDSQPSTPPTES